MQIFDANIWGARVQFPERKLLVELIPACFKIQKEVSIASALLIVPYSSPSSGYKSIIHAMPVFMKWCVSTEVVIFSKWGYYFLYWKYQPGFFSMNHYTPVLFNYFLLELSQAMHFPKKKISKSSRHWVWFLKLMLD